VTAVKNTWQNNHILSRPKDTDKLTRRIPHTSAIQTMHQAAWSGCTPPATTKADKTLHLTMTIACNKTAHHFGLNFSLILCRLMMKVWCVQQLYVARQWKMVREEKYWMTESAKDSAAVKSVCCCFIMIICKTENKREI